MTPALELRPRGRQGPTGSTLPADPAHGVLIKEERKTVVWRQTLPDGTRAVMKLYRHRKPSWLERRGLYTGRAEREFRALCQLEDHRVACSAPLFWACGESPETGRYELLATREVPDATDLHDWLKKHAGTTGPDLRPLFALAAAMHRTGLQHGALLGRNVLMAGRDFYLIDLPRSQRFGGSIEGRGPGWFDLKVLLQSLTPFLPDEALIPALSGYPRLPIPAANLVHAMRPQPLNNRRLNLLHAVYTVQAGCSRLLR
jgi:tRNA A-37 threonylcarbamoyl transferase component Bud32